MTRYLGTGDLEEKLVSSVNNALQKAPELKVKWFLDKVRHSICVSGRVVDVARCEGRAVQGCSLLSA